jgi:hypothetical protein
VKFVTLVSSAQRRTSHLGLLGFATAAAAAAAAAPVQVLEWTGQDGAYRELVKHRGKPWSQLPHGAKKALLAAADQLDWSFITDMADVRLCPLLGGRGRGGWGAIVCNGVGVLVGPEGERGGGKMLRASGTGPVHEFQQGHG